MSAHAEQVHNRFAPYWAIALVALVVTGLSTIWLNFGNFWNGYVLDITGPAWNYILFRRLSHSYSINSWTRFFRPSRTLLVFLVVCYGIETAQYFELYESTFDQWDLVAYASLLLPLYLIDVRQQKAMSNV